MNLHLTRAKVCAVVLLLLAASPCTAPFAVCDLVADLSHHHEDSATRHINHAGAVVRSPVKVVRHPVILSTGISRVADIHCGPGGEHERSAAPPPSPARHLVLRL